MIQQEHVLKVDLQVYSLTAIKKSIYRLAKQHTILLTEVAEKTALVTFQSKTIEDLEESIARFYRELIDQDLREIVAKETEALRNMILAQAFAPTSLLLPESNIAQYQQDPLNINQQN